MCVLFVVRVTVYLFLINLEIKSTYVAYGHTYMELFYVLSPSIIGIITLRPIFLRIYMFEECFELKIKLLEGRQWYWVNYLSSNTFNQGLSQNVRLFTKSSINFVIGGTAADVIHNLGLGAHMLKIDCYPGRINCSKYMVDDILPGQIGWCSELCGINHSFMPFIA